MAFTQTYLHFDFVEMTVQFVECEFNDQHELVSQICIKKIDDMKCGAEMSRMIDQALKEGFGISLNSKTFSRVMPPGAVRDLRDGIRNAARPDLAEPQVAA